MPLEGLALSDDYNPACLELMAEEMPLRPDDLTDDGALHWANYLLGVSDAPSLAPGASIYVTTGAAFRARAASGCDPTPNHLAGTAVDGQGNPVHAEDEAVIHIESGGQTATLTTTPEATTPVPTPSATPTRSTPSPTPDGPTPDPGAHSLYLSLTLKGHGQPAPSATLTPGATVTGTPIPAATLTGTSILTATPTGSPTPILDADFDDGALTGWVHSNGTWTNPGDHLRGEYALGNASNLVAASGGDITYEGTLNLLTGNAVGLVFRATPDGSGFYDVFLDAVAGVFKISSRPPYTVLASHSMTVQRNHAYRVKVVARGSTIEAYLDGVKLLTATDSTYTSGRLGVILFQATATYDDLIAWDAP